MKIAVPYENGEICSHLAQVKEFLIFDVVDDEIISTKTVKQTYANDPGALVEFLKKENTAVLLCRTTIKMALTPTPNATEISVPVGLGATNSCFI